MTIGDTIQYKQISGGIVTGDVIDCWSTGCLLLTEFGTVRLVNQLDVVEADHE